MEDLKTITALVKTLLEQDARCRNSDGFLYLRVLFTHAAQKGINLDNMTVSDFLLNHHGASFPIFESVRRTRQKVQQHHPELAACEAVEGFRAENEAKYFTYAVGDV